MTSPVTVSERDLRTLVHIITDSRADLPAEGLPPSLLSDLADQIRCDTVGFFGLDSGQQLNPFGQDGRPIQDRPTQETTTCRCSGSTTGTAPPAVTPTAAATCAA